MAKNPNQMTWLYNENNCIACRAASLVASRSSTFPLVSDGGGHYTGIGEVPEPEARYLSVSCNHCEEPSCLKACPVGAYSKEEEFGVVLHDKKKCIGCKRCIAACPYGAPQFNEKEKKVDKCDFCIHRLKAGLPPACVRTCMGYALSNGKMPDVEAGNAFPTLYLKPRFRTSCRILPTQN